MNLWLFFPNNYSHTKFFFALDGPLGSLSNFFHILSFVLIFWDPINSFSHLVYENWPIGGWGRRKNLRFSDWKVANHVFGIKIHFFKIGPFRVKNWYQLQSLCLTGCYGLGICTLDGNILLICWNGSVQLIAKIHLFGQCQTRIPHLAGSNCVEFQISWLI